MITTVGNVSFRNISKNSSVKNKNNKNNLINSKNSKNQKSSVENSIYSSSMINFKGYNSIETKSFFDYGVNNNYFKLPQKVLDDGTIYQIQPDESQLECAKHIYDGKSVIYNAPTGMGKTAIAHYCTQLNLDKNKKTIYTVPIKALANDKFVEFCKIYGEENVGLLTGERKINGSAPIVIMTTEIFDNQSSSLNEYNTSKIGTVIFDEAHYIADEQRGGAWEYSIINSVSKDVQILCLSATIGNGDEFTSWVDKLNSNIETKHVVVNPQNRPVPLIWHIYNGENFETLIDAKVYFEEEPTLRQKIALESLFKAKNNKSEEYKLNEEEYLETFEDLKNKFILKDIEAGIDIKIFEKRIEKAYPFLDETQAKKITQFMFEPESKKIKHVHTSMKKENYAKLSEDLNDENMLPAIIFKLTQGGCEDALLSVKNDSKVDLLSDEEKEEVEKIINEHKKKGVYLGPDFDKDILVRGFALHHAGRMPQYKKLIEELFSKKLIKVVFATSTLGAGINMPARTVVLSNTTYKKYNPKTKELEYTPLTANEFHQMAGRAGRRGIDEIGNVVLYNLRTLNTHNKNSNQINELELAYSLISSKPDDLRSQFRPCAPIIANAIEQGEDIKDVIKKSFKVHISANPEKEIENLNKKFENYLQILFKEGHCYKSGKKDLALTPKGKILSISQGMNPLMLSSLLYDEKLKDVSVLQLCQIAGYISGCDNQEESNEESDLMINKLMCFDRDENVLMEYNEAQKIYKNKEEKVLKALRESNVNYNDISVANSFSGYITYLWAKLNSEKNNSLQNFEKIVNKSLSVAHSENEDLNKEFSRKNTSGNIYRLLTQTITTLKQIERICEFTLSDYENYPNKQYWEELLLKTQKAIELMSKEPINNEINYENKLSNK